MKRTSLTRLVAAFCLIWTFVSTEAAQTVTGSLVGNVADASGGAVAGARVVATDIERGTKRESVTNEEGNYTISSMEPGTYRVEIEQTGFKKFVNERAEVRINSTVRVDAALEVGGVTEVVQITSGEQAMLKTDRSDLSMQITQEQVRELPLSPDRNYQSVLEITPGVSEAAGVGSAFGNPNGSLVNRVNGQNERNNSFQLDGTINNQTNVISQTAIVPPPEAIQVVDVATNAYDAESGRSTGGIVNVQIKSGTNNFHGDVFYYNTNSALAARETFSTLEKPHTNLTQFGFTFGGPIKRDKTFFFGDYQGGRDRQGQSVLLSVPTAEYRNGDFRATPTQIFDPTTGAANGTNRVAFTNNIIPQNRISPVARAILSRLPLPNRPGLTNNYEATGSKAQDRDSFDVKVNHIFSDNTNGFVRYSYFQAQTSDPPSFGILGGPTTANVATAAIGPSRNQSASVNLTHTFSPTLVTEFRAGLVRVLIEGEPPSEDDLATQVGIAGINDGSFFNRGLPRITISGFTFMGAAATLPFKIAETSYNFVNNWTKTKGNHTIRFGADIRNLILNKAQAGASPRGEFTFTTGPASRSGTTATNANAFASFLLGLPTTIARNFVNQLGGFRQRQYFFFGQDRWQASPKLTLNYGLRYEIYPYAVGANPGDLARYDPETNKNLIAGYGPVGERLGVKTDYTNFAPRFGIAYRVFEKTVLRAGYGIGYIPLGINALVTQNYPGQVNLSITGANSFQAAGNIANGVPPLPNVDPTSGVVTPPNNVVLGVIDPDAKRGYVQSFNATVQQDFRGFVTEASYVGSLGTRLPGTLNLNAAGPGAGTAGRPFARRYGRTVDILLHNFMLSSSYHALQTKLERRWRNIGTITAAYTWSKAIDYTDAFALQNDLNIDANRGLCDCDRTHTLVISHVLRSPFGRDRRFFNEGGVPGALLGGWTFSGVFNARSGTPIDITGVRLTNNAVQGTVARPNSTGTPRILGGTGPGELWFDTSVFVEPPSGTYGAVGRNTVRGPGYNSYNVTLARSFALTERFDLRFTATAFNVTNTPRYENPSGSFSSTDFGQINDTINLSERRIRFGLKLSF